MAAKALTGSRIRERRLDMGKKQANLARQAGISPAYLNLIEHNRRRIAGALLTRIARALEIEPGALAEGAEAQVLSALIDAAERTGVPGVELDRTHEFAGRFPGWARLIEGQHARIDTLERTVAELTDRMTHDPHLAASLHDILSTVTAIASTSAILIDEPELEPEWRGRFHRNIHEDSQRLAEASRALVSQLDATETDEGAAGSPQEELERWLAARHYHIAELEMDGADIADLLQCSGLSPAAQLLAGRFFERYRGDALSLPLQDFAERARQVAFDPLDLAVHFGVDVAQVLRRLSSLPDQDGGGGFGLVVCDGSGTFTLRKPVDGFPLPRFGAACPLWPLFQSLTRATVPMRARLELPGHERFIVFAIAQPTFSPSYDAAPVLEATMLLMPDGQSAVPDMATEKVGISCRICPRPGCRARRESSVLSAVDQSAA